MSNNFHPQQQLSESNNEMHQMEPFFQELSSISNLGMGATTVPMSNNYALQQHLVTSDMQMENTISYSPTSHSMPLPNQQVGKMEAMLNFGSQMEALPSKHGASAELNSYVPPQLSIPNNRLEQMDSMLNSPRWLQQSTPTKRKYVQMQAAPVTPGSQNLPVTPGSQSLPPVNKKMVRTESMSGRSGSQQTPKGRNAQNVPLSKNQTESFESVRSKMRETLAAALAYVSQNQDSKTSHEEKVSRGESATNPVQSQEDPRHAESTCISAEHVQENNMGVVSSDGSSPESLKGSTHTEKCNGQEFAESTVSRVEDVSFSDNMFVKDELLQGNGLLWAMELDADVGKTKLEHHDDVGGERKELAAVESPESLASKIEAELFKFFGGVNKKYKEKGRSLTFNLKDRSNPELRERVLSGEISPERLCSMTAEELASKELSEWRMAKAEELAQMIVLPDSDASMRRLVKKTHKGEFQVEVEQDDAVSVEVSVGTTLLTRIPAKKKEVEANKTSSKSDEEDKGKENGEKSGVGNPDLSNSLTIPSDGTDLMQGLMVDDFKDAEYLPPIVSLDEFMESLDTEPPFENLPVDAGKTIPPAERVNSEACRDSVTNPVTKDPADAAPAKAERKENAEKMDLKENSSKGHVEPKPSPHDDESAAIWEGTLQLNISAMVTAVGLFRSGDRTSTKEWSSSLEIKGRVRLDAFEKFLQELPMSRSRAVMITQFVLKNGSSENDRASLCEAVDSYVLDERLGFGEPAAGVEVYFCPPRWNILEMLGKHLSKEYPEMLKSVVDSGGLIGVVVWRKPHLISPNSHNKQHLSKKQHLAAAPSSRRQQQQQDRDDPKTNNIVSYRRSDNNTTPQSPPADDDDDDDIPPGFGPGTGRDDDDLPEFNFLGGSNPNVPKLTSKNQGQGVNVSSRFGGSVTTSSTRNPSHVRDLIHRYGQTGIDGGSDKSVGVGGGGGGIGIKPWEEDDDDIPEWEPSQQQQQQQQPQSQQQYNLNSFHLQQQQQQQPMLPPQGHVLNHMIQQIVPLSMHPIQPPPFNNPMLQQQQQGGGWLGQQPPMIPLPPAPRAGGYPYPGSGGQFHGLPPMGGYGQPRRRGY